MCWGRSGRKRDADSSLSVPGLILTALGHCPFLDMEWNAFLIGIEGISAWRRRCRQRGKGKGLSTKNRGHGPFRAMLSFVPDELSFSVPFCRGNQPTEVIQLFKSESLS
jgi:hypothetical protein